MRIGFKKTRKQLLWTFTPNYRLKPVHSKHSKCYLKLIESSIDIVFVDCVCYSQEWVKRWPVQYLQRPTVGIWNTQHTMATQRSQHRFVWNVARSAVHITMNTMPSMHRSYLCSPYSILLSPLSLSSMKTEHTQHNIIIVVVIRRFHEQQTPSNASLRVCDNTVHHKDLSLLAASQADIRQQ